MISDLIDDYPERLALVEMHVNDDGIDTEWAQQRLDSFYGVPAAVPTFVIDGSLIVPEDEYRYWLEQSLDATTDVTIALAAVQVAGPQWRVAATVCVEQGGAGKSMRVYSAALLDGYPNPPRYSRNTLTQDVVSQDLSVAAGACTDVDFNITFDTQSWQSPEDIRVVVWAQEPQSSSPAMSYQAAQMSWPFPATQQLTFMEIAPATVMIVVGNEAQFTASGRDQNGQPMTLGNPHWSVVGGCGTVLPAAGASSATFTATAVGECELLCQEAGVEARAALRVVDQALPAPRRIRALRRP